MTMLSNGPCEFCPYRRDVASGVWAAEEYDKLPLYDAPTVEQPMAPFACHATPDKLCYGWAVCHEHQGAGHELLALRLLSVHGKSLEVPRKTRVPLFSSGTEACEHGKRKIMKPGEAAKKAITKLTKKYKRLKA
jgi:hypothetical protein